MSWHHLALCQVRMLTPGAFLSAQECSAKTSAHTKETSKLAIRFTPAVHKLTVYRWLLMMFVKNQDLVQIAQALQSILDKSRALVNTIAVYVENNHGLRRDCFIWTRLGGLKSGDKGH